MLTVETYVDCTLTKGVGLFAKKFIAKGSKYWIRNEIFDSVFSPREFELLDTLAADYIKKYGFLETSGNWYLCNDNARFSNHSFNSNSKNHFDKNGIVQYCTASRDIEIGEEIMCNYTEICQTCIDGIDFESLN